MVGSYDGSAVGSYDGSEVDSSVDSEVDSCDGSEVDSEARHQPSQHTKIFKLRTKIFK